MIIILDYIRSKDTRNHKTLSLVRCEFCQMERTIEKSKAKVRNNHMCLACHTKYFI